MATPAENVRATKWLAKKLGLRVLDETESSMSESRYLEVSGPGDAGKLKIRFSNHDRPTTSDSPWRHESPDIEIGESLYGSDSVFEPDVLESLAGLTANPPKYVRYDEDTEEYEVAEDFEAEYENHQATQSERARKAARTRKSNKIAKREAEWEEQAARYEAERPKREAERDRRGKVIRDESSSILNQLLAKRVRISPNVIRAFTNNSEFPDATYDRVVTAVKKLPENIKRSPTLSPGYKTPQERANILAAQVREEKLRADELRESTTDWIPPHKRKEASMKQIKAIARNFPGLLGSKRDDPVRQHAIQFILKEFPDVNTERKAIGDAISFLQKEASIARKSGRSVEPAGMTQAQLDRLVPR